MNTHRCSILATLLAIAHQAPTPDAGLAQTPVADTHRRVTRALADLTGRLSTLRTSLRQRAASQPELLARLDAMPAAIPIGYGLLPELGTDVPESVSPPRETRYDYPALASWLARELGRAAELDARLSLALEDLPAIVAGYELAKTNHERIDQHVTYHRFWQLEVRNHPAFFQLKNQILADYRQWRVGGSEPGARAAADQARDRVERHLHGFQRVKAIPVEPRPDSVRALVLAISTDVTDERFLAAVTAGVERTWNQSEAMRAARLRVELRWDRRVPGVLYPEGAPERGARIDTAAHRKRFGPAEFVLTTGADSTHVLGDTLFLGTGPTAPRVLAHEIGHFLGFADGYLRAFEGSVQDPNGVALVELVPFPESLMASPASGRVTAAEAAALLEGYGIRD